MNEFLVSTREAASRLGIGRTKLFALMRDGEITAVRLGSKTLIPIDELARFAASLPTRQCLGACDGINSVSK